MTEAEVNDLIERAVLKASKSQCNEHSGMVVWIKIGCILLGAILGSQSWSTFVVAPEVKTALDKQIAINDKRFYALERDVSDLKVVDVKILSQRDVDQKMQ